MILRDKSEAHIPASRAHRYPFVHLLVGGVAPKPPFHAVLRPAAAHLSAERRYFQKLYLRKMPLSLLLFLRGLISLFHWLVQNSLHVRPNGQQFAHFVLCVSILGIILFSLCHKSFIFRLQHLNSRELRQFPFIKSLFSRSMNQNFLFMLDEKFPGIAGLFICRIYFARFQVTPGQQRNQRRADQGDARTGNELFCALRLCLCVIKKQ